MLNMLIRALGLDVKRAQDKNTRPTMHCPLRFSLRSRRRMGWALFVGGKH